jgi:hypothetical protein
LICALSSGRTDVVVEISLHEHVHAPDVVVAARDQLEQEDILVADQPAVNRSVSRNGSLRSRIPLVRTSFFATC